MPDQKPDSIKRKRIGEMLVDEGIITASQLAEGLELQRSRGGKLVENLIALQHLDARRFLTFLSRRGGLASVDLLNFEIPRDIIGLIPEEFALRHEVLPIDRMGKHLTVGMACPLDAASISELEEITGLKVRPLLVSMTDVRVALRRYYQAALETPGEPDFKHLLGPARPGLGSPFPAEIPSGEDAESEDASETESVLPRVESALTFESIVRLVREVDALPALPETISQVRAAMENPKSSTADIARIIARDPGLAAKVLSLANSPAYGFQHKVDSIEMATTLLGLREVYSVVLSSLVIDYFDRSRRFDYKAFWRRSLFCGTAARIIADTRGARNAAGIFSAGLLHDLGRLVFAEVIPERYAEVDQRGRDAEVIEGETERFGVAHPELGFVLGEHWNLPADLLTAMRFHHDPGQATEERECAMIVGLAALMTDAYGRITKENAGAFARECRDLLRHLGLEDQQFVAILGATSAAMKKQPEA